MAISIASRKYKVESIKLETLEMVRTVCGPFLL